jgi:hypothetical protein
MSDKKVKIIFYNFFNIGDTYFSQSFVKNIVDSNGENFEYLMWFNYNDHIITSLFPFMKNVRDNDELKQHILSHFYDMNTMNGINYYFIKESNVLLINTWIGCGIYEYCNDKLYFAKFYKYNLNECDVTSYTRTNLITINCILKDTKIKINYDTNIYNTDKKLTLPSFSSNINIDEFLDFRKCNENKKIVFLNNYFGNSQQNLPIESIGDCIRIIDFFIKKDYIVFLSEYNNELALYKIIHNIKDIYFTTEKFNIQVNISCYNVYYCAKVAHSCDVAIYFDTGKNFTYVNYDFIQDYNNGVNTNKKIHFGVSNHYFKNLSNPSYFPNGYADFIETNDCNSIISYLEQNIV